MIRNTPILSERPAWKRRALILMAALSVLLTVGVLAASCSGGTTATTATTPTTTGTAATTAGGGAGGAQVVMKNTAFDPATVTIKAGDSVTWTNQDPMNHTVIADNGEFKSSDLGQGATFTFKFDKAGTYPYHCSIHPSMTGTVVVQ
jgi:plastocyanin